MLPLALVIPLYAASSAFALTFGGFQIQQPLGAGVLYPEDDNGPPHHLPPFPIPKPPSPPGTTIYDAIHGDEKFSKLNKALDFVGDDIKSLLNDTSRRITFFAVPDEALLPPKKDKKDKKGKKGKKDKKHHKKKKHHKHKKDVATTDDIFDLALASGDPSDAVLNAVIANKAFSLADAVDLIEVFDEHDPDGGDGDDGDGDDDHDHDDEPDEDEKERRKRIFRYMVKAVLEYHVLPHDAYDIIELAKNTTHETQFQVPQLLAGHAQRVRVYQTFKKPVPTTYINFFSRVDYPNWKVDNGIIHVVNHPILPPPSAFQSLFIAQDFMSVFTSALQRVGLNDELDVRYVKDESHGHLEGSTAVTVFAPTNWAFKHLPPRLKFFLFSPFGHHVLRKLLEYHIVPGVVAHADVIHNQTAEVTPDEVQPKFLGSYFELLKPELVNTVNATFKTRLVNHTVAWTAEKYKYTLPIPHHKKEFYENKVLVNEQQVYIPDVVALNGAIHLIDHLLVPCHCQHREATGVDAHEDSWEDWEEWLPAWASAE